METRFHLARTYFSLENYQEASSILNENVALSSAALTPELEQIRRHSLYLMGLALKNLQQYTSAKNAFMAYTQSAIPPALAFYEEALFEMGLMDFLNQDYEKASSIFGSLKVKETNPRLYVLSQLYQARLALLQGNAAEAAKDLETLSTKLASEDPLLFELNYLQGETAFELHHDAQAIEYFAKALPSNSPKKPNGMQAPFITLAGVI